MLRECARYEALAKIMLNSDDFYNFFTYVEVSTFDIASDAFSTFKVKYCLTFIFGVGAVGHALKKWKQFSTYSYTETVKSIIAH